ncbi:MAG: DUF2235 domain-containing protein [Halioglobus sp.]
MSSIERKRIVICADGTWNDPHDETPTNVLRIARAIRPVDRQGVKQVVFYDWGVGSYYAQVAGGTSGLGMQKNIQDGYRFIVQNYRRGDEIFLIGFSRGAYTVRCLAGLLNNCGVLKRDRADCVPDAFNLYKTRAVKPGSRRAEQWRRSHTGSGARGPVHFIGVWDTVGALGIPTRALAFAQEKDLFYDPVLGSNIRMARHAVSIDEQRADFSPTLWENQEGVDVQQVWFAGVHADVGGGYAPTNGSVLSDIPLAWMAQEATKAGLQFEPHLYQRARLNPLAQLHRSHKRFWRVLGKSARSLPADAVVHQSVRQRFEAGDYTPDPLLRWLAQREGDWGSPAR